MASCSQVSSLLQAYIDGELGHAEKSIFEQHLRECGPCRHELNEQNGCSARIFESMAEHRLQSCLRSRVLAHLPDMDPAVERGSHPTDPQYARRRYRSPVPHRWLAAAAVLVVAFVGFYASTRPERVPILDVAIGMVTFSDSDDAYHKQPGATRFEKVALTALVYPGGEYETLSEGRLALSLVGGSTVKVNHDSSLRLENNRRVEVAEGLTWFDVGHDKRLFNVNTPDGDIMVYGTTFVVEVRPDATTLTVTEGNVLVSNDKSKVGVSRGNQLVFQKGVPLGEPYPVDADAVAAWANAIVPDADALALFLRTLELRRSGQQSIPAIPVHGVWTLEGKRVNAIQLTWTPTGQVSGHCGYIVHVADDEGNLLYIDTLDGGLFNDPLRSEHQIPLGDSPLRGLKSAYIKLIPDHTSGSTEVPMKVSLVAVLE